MSASRNTMAAMDKVFIEGLEVDTLIGAYDWERGIRQCLRLDLTFAWDIRPAAATDDLSQALDYAATAQARGLKVLIGAAGAVGLPLVFTEQYPQGLGHTAAALRAAISYSRCGAGSNAIVLL